MAESVEFQLAHQHYMIYTIARCVPRSFYKLLNFFFLNQFSDERIQLKNDLVWPGLWRTLLNRHMDIAVVSSPETRHERNGDRFQNAADIRDDIVDGHRFAESSDWPMDSEKDGHFGR